MEECVVEARALKSSFLSQKTSSQVVFCNDDLWCLAAATNSDDFPVEDLLNLDFSDKELQDDGCFLMEDDEEKASQETNSNDYSSIFSGADEFGSFSAGELPVQVEDLENLEWLSQFVDDSASGFSLACPTGNFTAKTEAARGASNRVSQLSKPVQKTRNSWFPTKVSRKPRSKPVQKTRNSWSLEISSKLGPSWVSSCSSGSTTMSRFVFTNPVQDMELLSSVEKPPAKKQKIKQETSGGFVSGRRCTHCLVQKTPQWRAGPLGPKTLCNACGVRFKSGRLFPEYRPACSPTFSQDNHSNSHRKVLEMRRRKEMPEAAEQELTANV